MNYSDYSWNLAWSVWGLIAILEGAIKCSRTDGWERIGHFMFGHIFGTIGGWNLICLLVKLNVIHP